VALVWDEESAQLADPSSLVAALVRAEELAQTLNPAIAPA
jgi:hypothetical protein